MVTQETTTVNGITLDTLQKTVAAVQQNPELGKCRFRARNKWINGTHNHTAISDFYAAGEEMTHREPFDLHADEPAMMSGTDQGANPVEHLLNALASCMTTSMVAYAALRGIHIEELESQLEGNIDLRGFFGLDQSVPKGFSNIRVHFRVKADTENMEQLKHLAQFSPTYNTIVQGAMVDVDVQPM